MRVADYIATTLETHGVRAAFLLSGGGMMHLIDAVGRLTKLRYYCHHHEQACAMAADGYARQTGGLGVVYATSGPGATNLLTGLVGAWQDSTPLLFLTGQSKSSQTIHGSGITGLRQFGTFEVDIVPIVRSVTKYAAVIEKPSQARYHLERALRAATTGRPGPVLLDVPLDVQGAVVDPARLEGCDESPPTPPRLSAEDFRAIWSALRSARRPLILAGYGVRCAGVVSQFRESIARWRLPVVTTQLAKDILPFDHELFIGHPGVRGDRAGNFAVQNADVIVSLGCSLHAQTVGYDAEQFAPRARKFMVDPDDAILQRASVGVERRIQADIADFLLQSREIGAVAGDPAWQSRCSEWKRRYDVRREPHPCGGPGDPINYYELADRLSDSLSGNETIITDCGSAWYVLGQGLRIKGQQRFLSSGAMGTMGFTLPACTGAAVAAPERMIVGVTGDGSLQTNVHELAVHKHHQLNIKLFVVDNDGYLSIRNTQRQYFRGFLVGSSVESGVWLPPIGAIAAAYGLPFVDCPDRQSLAEAIRRTLATPGPVICRVAAMPDQPLIPSVASRKLADGRMVSKPLHDMTPFLDEHEMAEQMCW